MLDLRELPTTAAMRMTKTVPRREGAGIAWDVELSMEIPDEVSAQVVESYVPGTFAVWVARESSKGEAKTSGGFDLARVEFRDAEDKKLARGHCEVRGATVKVSASMAVLCLRVRIHGLVQETATRLVYALDESVTVTLSEHGQHLSLIQPDPVPSLEGRLVVHDCVALDRVIAGIVSKQEGRTIWVATLEDEEAVPIVLPVDGRPDTMISVTGDKLRDILVDYTIRCDKANVRSSWLDVVKALGVMYASQDLSPSADSSWELTEDVLDHAFEVASGDAE
jgi:hypothetical protein